MHSRCRTQLAHVPEDILFLAHDKGVPEKIVAELMGHSNVSTTLSVYTQVLQESVKIAVNRIGEELFSIVQSGERAERANPLNERLLR
jgi:hypothetical protein